ncbi:MAG: leucine-rich repeat domain-containing protein [Bacteroidaceae bacterium]|nr:leucine-rich repeat domain-containing protein [Bacteroidaceae bacterium]
MADYYYGSVTLLKAFYGFDAGVVNDNDLLIWKNLMYAGDSNTVTIGSMPYGVTATADLILDAGFKKAVVGQVVTIGFSGVPDGKVPVVSVTYGAYNYEVFDIFDNGDGTFSFVMPDKSATVTVSELKNDIKSCTATVPDLSLGSNTSINYKFWDTPATIGETVTDDETTLTLGTDYQFGRITYADLTNHSEFDMPDHVGDECLVEIKGIGNYGGSKYVRFDIVNPSGNGTWGDLSWALSNGELTISGTGDMVKPQNDGTYPWLTYKSYIKTITIEEDVTSVADGAFSTAWNDYHYEVSTVSLPSTLTSIGEDAFAYCTGATITIPTGVTSIGNGAFLEVSNVVGSLDDNADNATLISLMHEAKRADVTISGRTLKKDGSWNTLCLPFDVDDFSGTPLADATVLELDVVGYYDDNNERYIKENDKYFKGQTEYTGVTSGFHQTGIDGNTLHIYFNPVARIKAGEPYLVKWEVTGENVENPEFTDVKVCDYATADKATTSKDGKVKFVGSYNPYASTGSAFLKESADASAQNAFRAFVKVNSVETIYSVQACNEPATILQTGNSMVYYVKNTLVLTETAGVEGLITHAVATDQLVSFTRSGLTANAYSTMCLPFSFKAPSACTFYAFKGIGWNSSNQQWEATISQQDANATLSAHTPYIFKCAETEATFTGTIATLPASYGDTDLNTGAVDASDGDDRNWKFKGTYTALDWTSAAPTEPTYGFSTYVPYNDGNTAGIAAGTFVRFIKGASLAPFRARLIYSGTNSHLNKASIRGTSDNADLPRYIVVRIVSDNGTITTVGAVDTETGEITNDVWFTLEGKMLTGEPTESGIYIYKGQKVSISK